MKQLQALNRLRKYISHKNGNCTALAKLAGIFVNQKEGILTRDLIIAKLQMPAQNALK